MRHSLRYRPLLKRILQLALILILVQSIVDYRRSRVPNDTLTTANIALPPNQKIFIASIHWNNEAILRSHWVPAVLNLVRHFGKDNVYVSVQESGSWDDSKGALRELDDELERLGSRRRILLDDTTHDDEIAKTPAVSGWIHTARGKTELRRVPYLARLRNLVLEPLQELAEKGERFDRILFLNDVVFTTTDILRLLATHSSSYAAACSLDFSHPPSFYDTFALRDSSGNAALMPTWPFFRSRASREAIKANQPVPVKSCWNGIVAMDAAPFYEKALRFRGTPDGLAAQHVEASECCLIHADNPLSASKGVWLNPSVRVGYSAEAYEAVSAVGGRTWVGWAGVVHGCWENRILRWFTTGWFEEWDVGRRVRRWGKEEQGLECLVDEMQVLVGNGWAHV